MSDTTRALKDKATELTAKGKLPKALETWQQVVATDPGDIAARQKVAEVFAKLGKKPEALKAYEEVARRYAEKGLFFKASAVCRLVLALDPAHVRTQELIATLYAKDKKVSLPLKAPAPAEPAAPKPAEVEIEIAAPGAAAAAGEVEIPLEAPPPGGLPAIPLFSTLNIEELKEVLSSAMEVRAFGPGDVVVAEGAPGDSMFALVEGTAGIFRGWGTPTQRRVAALSWGEIFGEVALLSGAPRVATVVTDGDAVALEFPRAAMAKLISRFPRVGEMLAQFCQERLLENALRASPLLRGLPDPDKQALAASFKPATFVDGQRIIEEGAAPEFVYVLVRGVCRVTHASGEAYPDLHEGDVFGELSVLAGGAATATVRATGTALTLRLPATEFKARVLQHPEAKQAVEALARARLERTADLDLEQSIDIVVDTRV